MENQRPVFVVTHPRACSTAFERVFMTRRDVLASQHEPFSSAYYFGSEFLSDRFRHDGAARRARGLTLLTYKSVLDHIDQVQEEGKRVLIKDMAYVFFPPPGQPLSIMPSLGGGQETENPTIFPRDVLKRFQFTFLIRHPRRAVPSHYRCTVPPRNKLTGYNGFEASEVGYEELVRLLEFLIREKLVDKNDVLVVDADELLAKPEATIRHFCARTGIAFDAGMLAWNEADRRHAIDAFSEWPGFHDVALDSTGLRACAAELRSSTIESENAQWEAEYGPEAQKLIRRVVDDNTPYYDHLKSFCHAT